MPAASVTESNNVFLGDFGGKGQLFRRGGHMMVAGSLLSNLFLKHGKCRMSSKLLPVSNDEHYGKLRANQKTGVLG